MNLSIANVLQKVKHVELNVSAKIVKTHNKLSIMRNSKFKKDANVRNQSVKKIIANVIKKVKAVLKNVVVLIVKIQKAEKIVIYILFSNFIYY